VTRKLKFTAVTDPIFGLFTAKDADKTNVTPKAMQILSAAAVSFTHGANDGQKMMGVITLVLATQFKDYGFTTAHIPFLVMVVCALAIGLGTAIGGENNPVIQTVGTKLSSKPIEPTSGAIAQICTAATIYLLTLKGFPVSTTHVQNSAVVGAQVSQHGPGAASYKVLGKIAMAWVVTIPVCAAMSAGLCILFSHIF
jgi:PiT family inorganic phosphate transporter